MKALGTYNFAGDIGKMSVPAAASLLLVLLPWQPVLAILGLVGLVAAAAIFWLAPRLAGRGHRREEAPQTKAAAGGGSRFGFPVLLSIGMIDSATRMGFLIFLPFVLIAKGASLPTVGLALTLVFAGGAAGKLVCAFIGARIGVIATVCLTEGLTTAGILALLPLPLEAALVVLPVIGIMLNGTSSVLYGSVPELVEPEQAHAHVRHLLHRHDRLGRGGARALRSGRRRGRRADGADGGGGRLPADAAARAGAAADAAGERREAIPIRFADGRAILGRSCGRATVRLRRDSSSVTLGQMNPHCNYYLAINTGFPNRFDRANTRDGSLVMIHGDCRSAGCFAMTEEQISEIYSLERDTFEGGRP